MTATPKSVRRLVIILLALLLAIALTALLVRRYNETHFTPDKWQAAEWNDRQLLVRSFLRQYDLKQMTKSDIIALLGGEPDFYNDYAVPNRTADNLVYDFGESKGLWGRGRNITLVIEFDGTGYVSVYELFTYSQ
jgi:hypothetical protein